MWWRYEVEDACDIFFCHQYWTIKPEWVPLWTCGPTGNPKSSLYIRIHIFESKWLGVQDAEAWIGSVKVKKIPFRVPVSGLWGWNYKLAHLGPANWVRTDFSGFYVHNRVCWEHPHFIRMKLWYVQSLVSLLLQIKLRFAVLGHKSGIPHLVLQLEEVEIHSGRYVLVGHFSHCTHFSKNMKPAIHARWLAIQMCLYSFAS